MPRAYITKEGRQRAKLSAWIYGQMKIRNIPQREIADRLHITQQGFNRRLREQRFSFEDLLVFVDIFKPDIKEVADLLEIK